MISDTSLQIYQDGKHQLHCEIADVKEQVLSEIVNWILARS